MAAGTPAFERRALAWSIYGLVGYFGYLEALLGPIMPFLRIEQGLGYTVASLHFAAFAAGGVVAGGIADRLTVRSGRRAALWGGAIGMLLGAGGIVAGRGPVATIAASLVMGTFGAILLVTTQSALADRYGERSTIALTESNIVASGCGMAASVAVGSLSATALGWRAAVVPPLLVLPVLFLLTDRPLGMPRVGVHDGDSTLPRAFWTYFAVVFLGVAAEWCIGFWGATLLSDAVALSASAAAGAMGLFFGAMLVGRFATSRAARRVSGPALLLGALIMAAFGFAVLRLAPNVPGALAGLVLTGLGLSATYPVGVSVAIAMAPSASDTAAARLSIAAGAAMMLTPFAVGGLADAVGIASAFAVVWPVLVAAAVIAEVGRRMANARGREGGRPEGVLR